MHISLHHVTDAIAYWVVTWTIVNALLPPREMFKDSSPSFQSKYNLLLKLVAFYGQINVRQLVVQTYSQVQGPGDPTAPEKKP